LRGKAERLKLKDKREKNKKVKVLRYSCLDTRYPLLDTKKKIKNEHE